MDKETKEKVPETVRNNQANPANKIFFIGVAIVFFGVFLGGTRSDGSFSIFTMICVFIASLVMAYSGVVVVIRKEAPRPGLPSIRGIGAVIIGLLVSLTFGFAGIGMLVSLVMELLQK